MDVVLFIWDQFFITSDVAGFHKQLLPALMAIFFKLLRHRLKDCDTVSATLVMISGVILQLPFLLCTVTPLGYMEHYLKISLLNLVKLLLNICQHKFAYIEQRILQPDLDQNRVNI